MLAALALILHKVRRLHIAMFELTDKVGEIHAESKENYGQIQAYLDLVRLLKLESPLPRLRGWAASPDFLLVVAKHALQHKPKMIVECSSGASTIVLAQCLKMNGTGHVYSLEHDIKFAEITRQNLSNAGLLSWATVIDAPLKSLDEKTESIWYTTDGIDNVDQIDMLVVDGPPASTCHHARHPALPRLKMKFAPICHLFLDDADRKEEQETVSRWQEEKQNFKTISTTKYMCEKGCVHITLNKANS